VNKLYPTLTYPKLLLIADNMLVTSGANSVNSVLKKEPERM